MRLVHISEVLLPVVLAATANAQTKPTIVLVHGAFADAAGWSDVIARLQKRGYNVVAVENPLTVLAAVKALVFVAALAPDANEPLQGRRSEVPAAATQRSTEAGRRRLSFRGHPDAVVGVIVAAATAALANSNGIREQEPLMAHS